MCCAFICSRRLIPLWLVLFPVGLLRSPAVTSGQDLRLDQSFPSVHSAVRVSDQFYSDAVAAAGSVPDAVWKVVLSAGWQVQLAEFVVDTQPDLATDQPRGWPDGTSWWNADAAHFPVERRLVLAEKRRDQQGRVVLTSRVGGVLRHELGHALDMATGGSQPFRSASAEFREAYRIDRARLDSLSGPELTYYLQDPDAGRQEVFAECFAILCGGGSDVTKEAIVRRGFPTVLALLESELAAYSGSGSQIGPRFSDRAAIEDEPSRSEPLTAPRGLRARRRRVD